MRNQARLSRNIATGAALALVVVAWVLFGPAQLGGRVFYVVTDGISMQPRYHDDDLVIVRASSSYDIGDVAAYRSKELGRVVLHRIVDREGSRYAFKGDNNSWIDSERPESADVLGRAWIDIPQGGKIVGWLGEPVKISLIVALVALAAVGLRDPRGRHRTAIARRIATLRKRIAALARARSSGAAWAVPRSFVAGGAAIATLFLLLSLTAMARPTTQPVPGNVSFEHRGSIAYTADVAKGAVYQTNRLTTGQPVYLRLVDEMEVTFDYRFDVRGSHALSGTASLDAVLGDSTGWRRTIQLDNRSAFEGRAATARGTLNLNQVNRMIEGLQEGTGLVEARYTLTVVPRVQLAGTISGTDIDESFSPALAFQIDPFRIYPLAAGDQTDVTEDPFNLSEKGTVRVTRRVPTTMSLGLFDVSVAASRLIFALGLLVSIAATGFFAAYGRRFAPDEGERIKMEHGDLLVPVKGIRPRTKSDLVEVGDFASLVKLAHRYERVILHQQDARSYFVEYGGHVYAYVVHQNGKKSATAKTSSSRATSNPRSRAR